MQSLAADTTQELRAATNVMARGGAAAGCRLPDYAVVLDTVVADVDARREFRMGGGGGSM